MPEGMRFVVVYTSAADGSKQRREEWSFTREQAEWTYENLKRIGADCELYELIRIK